MLKFIKVLLLLILILGIFSFISPEKSSSKMRIIPTKTIKISRPIVQNTSAPVKLNYKYFPEGEININPLEWANNQSITQTTVYKGGVFENCQKQKIIKLPNNAQVLALTCGKGGRPIIIGNGLNTPVFIQAWPLLERLLQKNPNATIYLSELYGQGLTHAKLENDQIAAPDLRSVQDPFAHYEDDMTELFGYIQQKHPNQKGMAISLSSSAMSIMSAMQKYPNLLEKAIFNGPYLGLNTKDKLLQFIGHRLSFLITRRFALTPFADPFKTSWGLCSEPLEDRIKLLEEYKSPEGVPALYLPIFYENSVCPIGSQIQNPPIEWTNSANKTYTELLKTLETNPLSEQTKIIFIRGSKDTASDLGNLQKMQKLLPNAQFISIEGEGHNGYLAYPDKICDLALK